MRGMDRALCRGARAIAGINQYELARAAGIGRGTVIAFEQGRSKPWPHTLAAIRGALQRLGVEFAEHGGALCIRPAVR